MWLRYSRVMEATAPLILCLKSVASESSWGTYKRSFIKSPKEKISISGKLGCHRKQGLSSSRCWPIQNLEKTFNQSLTELCQSANVLFGTTFLQSHVCSASKLSNYLLRLLQQKRTANNLFCISHRKR